MTAGKAPQAILRVMPNFLSESDSEGTYSIILEPFAVALALNFALALGKPLVCLKFALVLVKSLLWSEICSSTEETPALLEICPTIGKTPSLV